MLKVIVFILVNAWYIALIMPFILFLYRLVLIKHVDVNINRKLFMLLMPFSYGLFKYYEKEEKLKLYNILVVLTFILTCLGALFMLYVAISK